MTAHFLWVVQGRACSCPRQLYLAEAHPELVDSLRLLKPGPTFRKAHFPLFIYVCGGELGHTWCAQETFLTMLHSDYAP